MAASKDLRVSTKLELPKGEEGMWMMIRKLGAQGSFTAGDVAAFSDCRTTSAQGYLVRLELHGYVRRSPEGHRMAPGKPHLFELVRDTVLTPRILRDGTVKPEQLTETLWRSMRMLKRFTIKELADIVEENGKPANVASIRSYVTALAAAEILKAEGKGSRHGWQLYRLVRATGPQAPKLLAARVVFDPNAKAMVGVSPTREVAL